MKKVYVASPVRPVLEDDNEKSPFRQFKKVISFARSGCDDVKKMGFVPISPILAFDGVYDEYRERERIDEACEALLLGCDFIYVVQTDYNKDSKGIARELDIAQKHGITHLFVMPKDNV